MLDPRQLDAFAAVVRTGSTVAAAEVLNLSQPSVSRLIHALEHATGLLLFSRVGGRLVVTEAGRLFHAEVERLHLSASELAARATDIRRAGAELLRIATVTAGVAGVVADAVAALSAEDATMRPSVAMRSRFRVVEMVASGRADIGLANQITPQDPVRVLRRWEFACRMVMPPDHPLAARETIGPDDLAGASVISMGDVYHEQAIDDPSAVTALRDATQVDANLSLVACRLAEVGLGIALVDPLTAVFESRAGRLVWRPFRPTATYQLSLILPLTKRRSTATRRLAALLADRIETLTASEPRSLCEGAN